MNLIDDCLTDKQRKAIMTIVIDSMLVDGLDPSQQRLTYLQTIYNLIELDDTLYKEVMSEMMQYDDASRILNTLPLKEKARIALVMYHMFIANGTPVIDKQRHFFNLVDSIAHLKDALIKTGLIHWKAGINALM